MKMVNSEHIHHHYSTHAPFKNNYSYKKFKHTHKQEAKLSLG